MKRFAWEPGNGTRYDIVYGALVGTDKFLLSWMKFGGSGGVSIIFSGKDLLHHTYVEEKMGVNTADANGILAFVEAKGHLVGRSDGDDYQFHKSSRMMLR